MLKTQIVTTLSDQLLTDWGKLWEKSQYANMTNSPGWFKAAMNAYDYKDIKIITVYDDKHNELLAIAPFVKSKIFGISMYTTPALEFADRPQFLLDYKDKKLTEALFSTISKLENTYLAYFTQELLDQVHLPKSTNIFESDMDPYIDFSQGPYGNLSQRKRNVVLNRLKKSDQKYEIIAAAPDPKEALEKAFEIDITSTKHRKGKGVFQRKNVREFYKQLAISNPENVIVTLVFFEKKPVAYLIGFLSNNIHIGSQKAFVSGYEYFNLGRLSLISLLDYFRQNGSPEFDFGRGYDQFKKNFTGNYHQLYNLVISKNKLLQIYVKLAFDLQSRGYKFLSNHRKTYSLYHRIKDALE